jgi:hypothetical protein
VEQRIQFERAQQGLVGLEQGVQFTDVFLDRGVRLGVLRRDGRLDSQAKRELLISVAERLRAKAPLISTRPNTSSPV